jgi:hypothetical protein
MGEQEIALLITSKTRCKVQMNDGNHKFTYHLKFTTSIGKTTLLNQFIYFSLQHFDFLFWPEGETEGPCPIKYLVQVRSIMQTVIMQVNNIKKL